MVRVLGKGAMGVVYEGLDPNLDRRVAIKTIMVDDLSRDAAAEYEARFRVEARSAARLQHPNIVTVYDSDRDGDTAFLVMEFIEGDDLKQHLDRGVSYDTAGALRLIVDLLAALDFAHRQGVVHRDVKPANLLIETGGRLKLTDFGVARIAGEATRTQGSMIGTLKYMAPEQVQGQKTDGRADLYSAAVVAYHLLTGVRPFDGDNDFTIIHQIIGHTPAAPSSIKPDLPAAVDAVFERALAKSRDDRFQTGADFSMALRRALHDVVQEGPDAPTVPGTVPGIARRSDTLPGAPADHQLELEYWRAIRDSVDAGDMEGFLARFPQGIYADLARRRLERLTGSGDPERTVLQGMTKPPGTAAPVESTSTMPFERSVPAGGATATEPVVIQFAQQPAAAPAPPSAGATSAKRSASSEDTTTTVIPLAVAASAKPPFLWIGGAAVAVFAAIALWLGPGRAPAPAPTTVDAPAGAPAPVVAQPASAPAIAATPAAAAASASLAAAAPAASAPGKPVAKAHTPAPQGTATAKRQEGARAARRDVAETSSRSSGERPVSPDVTCRDKVFISRQICVYNECQKPGYGHFQACVQLREDAKLREGKPGI
nr:serine/threonine-protein kinase [Ramlibacter algicola]